MTDRIPAAGGGRGFFIQYLVALLLFAGSALPAFAFETIYRIKDSGILRVGQLSPATATASEERALASRLARRLGVEAQFLEFVGYDALLGALRKGTVDLVAEPLSLQRPLPDSLTYTLPVRHSGLWLVTSPYVAPTASGRAPLMVHFQSDAWYQALALQDAGQRARLQVARAGHSRAELLDAVATGRYAASLAYTHEFEQRPGDGLKARRRLHDDVALSWVLRAGDRVLGKRVDDFLREHSLTHGVVFADNADWPQIQQRGRLRLVTRYHPAAYMAWSGQLLGFEFELVRAFARHHGLALDVVIARDRDELLQRLRDGEADLAADALMAKSLGENLVSAGPYFHAGAAVVSRAGQFRRLGVMDLHHRSLAVAKSGAWQNAVTGWQQAGIGLNAQWTDDDPVAMIDAVASGQADFALVDRQAFQLQALWRDDVESLMSLPADSPRVWAVRDDSPKLAGVINDYWRVHVDGRRVRLAQRKYFSEYEAFEGFRQAARAFQRDGRFSPFDDTIRRYAAYYAFDWRLILAMIFQESRFDPAAVSRTGARGLMQVQNAAAQQVGIDDLFDPQSAIHAGVRYLDWVRDQFEPELKIRERTWFSLAAYNGGLSHVIAARALAGEMGLDNRVWFGNVEKAMTELASQPRYAALDARQVTDYVRRIRDHFGMYVRLTEHDAPAVRPPQRQVAAHSTPTTGSSEAIVAPALD